MVDNRAAGFYGVAGAFNFKSGDISGTAAKTSDDRASQGTEYGRVETPEDQQAVNGNKYIDNSAQLNATLNSLAMMNVASVINSKLPKLNRNGDLKKLLEEAEQIVHSVAHDDDEEKRRRQNRNEDADEDDVIVEDDNDNEYF